MGEDPAAAEVFMAVAKETSTARRGSKTRAAAAKPYAVMYAIASDTEQETRHVQQEKEQTLAGNKRPRTAKDQSGHTQDGAKEAEKRQ